MSGELLQAALEYASWGWRVFPVHSVRGGACTCGKNACKRIGKHPVGDRVPDGPKNASADPAQVRAWWLAVPWANIGVATGAASGLVALDVDVSAGKVGEASLEALLAGHPPLPDTPEQITGSGGRHILFRHPGVPVKNSAGKLGQALDIRGDGGYIIAPPSRHASGRRYEWEASSEPAEVPLAPPPDWLVAKIRQRAPSNESRPQGAPAASPLAEPEIARIRAALPYCDCEDREAWLTIGMALHATGAGEPAYALWEDWSRRSDKFNAADQARVWASFKPGGGIHLGTLFAQAKAGGWSPPGRTQPPDPPAERSEGVGHPSQAPPENIPPDEAPSSGWHWTDGFLLSRDGFVKGNPGNVELVLRHDPGWKGVLSYCLFSNRIYKLRDPPYRNGEAGEWDDSDMAQTRVWMSHKYKFCGSDGDTVTAALVAAKHNAVHPVRAYLDRQVWDGTERIAHLLLDVCEAQGQAEYLRLVATFWLVAAVKRIYEPGCKHDYMLVLEGAQGQGKSTWARILGGEWFSDGMIPLGDRDAYQNIQGVWIQELAELAALNKSDSYQAKLFISQAVDRYRPSYGRFAKNFPRQAILFGSTNDKVWIKDPTGEQAHRSRLKPRYALGERIPQRRELLGVRADAEGARRLCEDHDREQRANDAADSAA